METVRDELVCQKSCPLVNDKKSNVRIREEKKEERQELQGRAFNRPSAGLESLGHHVATLACIAYILSPFIIYLMYITEFKKNWQYSRVCISLTALASTAESL